MHFLTFFSTQDVVQMFLMLALVIALTVFFTVKRLLSNSTMLLLGIGIICVSEGILEGKLPYGLDEYITVAGISLFLSGLIKAKPKNT